MNVDLLITGGTGFVGRNLVHFFASRMSVLPVGLTMEPPSKESFEWVSFDVTDEKETLSAFEKIAPQIVIHAAGNKNVRYCEAHPDEAYRVNALGTQNVARACRSVNAHMIYISTDLVFKCIKGGYEETDIPCPTLTYGKTKLQGEEFVRQELENVTICRTGGLYGKNSPLLSWVHREIQAKQIVECFTDVYNTPTYIDNFAEMLLCVIEKKLQGTFHMVGSQRVNRFQFFQEYARIFELDESMLKPISVGDQMSELYLLPDSSLSSQQSFARIGVHGDNITEGLTRLRKSGGV